MTAVQHSEGADEAPFNLLAFTISKPQWGTSSLVITTKEDEASPSEVSGRLGPKNSLELRLKRIEGGIATTDTRTKYDPHAALLLDQWIHSLGFCSSTTSGEVVPHAGLWSFKMSRKDGTPDYLNATANDDELSVGFELRGTRYPDSFPDLLTTMIGLGLPGFQHMQTDMFLSDFCIPNPPADNTSPDHAASSSFESLLGGLGSSTLSEVFDEVAKDPGLAEDALRQQLKYTPFSVKQQLLDHVRRHDPEHYEWWRRLLFG